MLKFKKIIIFLVIVAIIVSAICILPIKKINDIRDKADNSFMLGESEIYKNVSAILNSNVDQQYKTNALVILTDGAKVVSEQRQGFYKILLYIGIITTLLIALIGYLIIKYLKDKKYIGWAFLTGAIISLILILLYTFGIYMSLK